MTAKISPLDGGRYWRRIAINIAMLPEVSYSGVSRSGAPLSQKIDPAVVEIIT
jgi:hypothetical protein